MKTFRESWKLFRYNLSSIIVFELMYKLIAVALLTPLFYSILNYSVKSAGIKYLSTGTMTKYFRAPSTYLLLFCILVIVAMYLLINISGLIYAMESSHRREKTNSLKLLFKGTFNSMRIINPRNFGIMVYVLFVLPLTYTIMISGSLLGVKLPEFFNRFLRKNKYAVIAALIIYFVLCIISLRKLFSLNYFSVYKLDYKDAVRLSKKAIRKHAVKVLLGIVIYNLVITAVLIAFESALVAVLAKILSEAVHYKKLNFIFSIIIQFIFFVLYIIASVISTPLIYSYICTCFYEYEGDADFTEFQKVKDRRNARRKELTPKQIKFRQKLAAWIVVITSLCLNSLYIYLSINNKVRLNIMYSTRAEVTAHRGDSQNAPENTMAAIRLAVENQADIIEIDVRQTRDGQFVVMHDESLYRTTGIDKKVGEVDLAYIKSLDAGSKFSEEYKGEAVPTLEEVLEYAKEEDIFLNIELKPADTDRDYTEGIVDMLVNHEYIDNCVVASSEYKLLKQVKEINPEIKTVYIMSMAFGKFGDMDCVDVFSIRHNYISNDIVKDIHRNGKEIYAWTVNNENDIKELLLLDVDSVITDDPYNTKDIIYKANDSILTDWLQRLIEEY